MIKKIVIVKNNKFLFYLSPIPSWEFVLFLFAEHKTES